MVFDDLINGLKDHICDKHIISSFDENGTIIKYEDAANILAYCHIDYDKKMGKVTAFHTLVKPAYRFIKHFVFSGGFLDGYVGYRISKYAAWSVYLRYYKVLEIRSKHK